MAQKIRIEMNRAGIIACLQAPGVRADLLERANRMASTANSIHPGDYAVSAHTGKTRVRVSVITADKEARLGEAIDRALTRAMGAAGGPATEMVKYVSRSGKESWVTAKQAANYKSRSKR